jgi:lysophospholipase L1-like esterase
MEDNGGVIVDNFSVRSNNGHAIFGTSATVNRQIDDMLGYDLVVLQYGLNIMQKGQRGYSKYRDQLRDMIAYAERCFPNASIVVLGVSDRWVKNAESGSYEPIGSVDALTSYQRAAADSCKVAFWNTSKVMKELGGMPAFVSNGWAAKDYTHINYAGGRRIARAFAESILLRVYQKLYAAEESARIEAERIYMQRMIREQEARERLDSQINAITPIIDSISWHDIMATDDEIAISEE